MTASEYQPPEALLRQLLQRAAGDAPDPEPCHERIAVEAYTDPERFEREHARLILQQPQLIGHESQLPAPGDSLVFDWLGLPLVTLRDRDGELGTFMNVCRHRGMRLLQEEGQTHIRSLVCPYHQWTYGLDGALRNIPRAESFSDLDPADHGLLRLPTEVRQGLIWVQGTPGESMAVDRHLGDLATDFARFGLADYRYCRQKVRRIRCNWKLIQDAFLDGYHVVRLHKHTVGPFFADALAESDVHGRHIRSAVARHELFEMLEDAHIAPDLRRHATFSYTLFPNVVLIFHPEYISLISLFPISADETTFVHGMLAPATSTADSDHFDRSFELIDSGVFAAEDIFVSEGTQRGLRSGANTHLHFGALEAPAAQFQRIIEEAL